MQVVFEKKTVSRKKAIPNGVLGMLIFVGTEIMFFLGFISAFSIVKSGSVVWPPPDQPRLPVELTTVNTAFLILSGLCFFLCGSSLKKEQVKKTTVFFLSGTALACVFVFVQGYEWIDLLSHGLTMMSSSYGSFFYMIIGCHALHAFVAIAFMVAMIPALLRGTLSKEKLYTLQTFWYFVVGIWPLLFLVVYF